MSASLGGDGYRDPAASARRKAALHYNAEHLEVMSMSGGLDDRGFRFKSSLASGANEDFLGRYLPEARKNGIRVLIYFDVHWYSLPFAEKHPDWRQMRENGKPLDGVYDTGADFCVNGPWRDWVIQVLRDLAAYPIDGIFFDGPVFRADTCYCRYCREKFRNQYHKDMPTKQERRGEAFRQLVEFQAASLADFLRDSRRVLKSINPELALYMNGGLRGSNWATARLNRVLVPEQDLLGSEGGFLGGDLTRVPLWKPGLTARLLETQSGGKPRVIFSAASHKPWTFSLLPDAELRLLYADTIANAASVWFGVTPFEIAQPEMQSIAEMNRYFDKNRAYYQDTRSEARVAVVWSDTTANFYAGSDARMIDIDRVAQRSEVGDLEAEFSGVSESLLRAQVPFDVIDDTSLERDPLDRYAALFLPNVACMSDAVAARVREFVQRGGHLFATFETSLYDQNGIGRADFALGDVLGASSRGGITGPARWDYVKPVSEHPLLEGLKRAMMPGPVYHVQTTPRDARVLLQFMKPLAGRYDGVPLPSDDPALTVHPFGKGTVVYSSGDLGALVNNFHLPEYLQLTQNTVQSFAAPQVELTNAPSSVEVVLRSQQDGQRLLLHLINFTGDMTRPVRTVVPLTGISASVAGGPWTKAYTLFHPQKVALRKDAQGRSNFSVPRLKEYEVVVLEK